MADERLGQPPADARHIGQQMRGSRVDIDADIVDDRLHDCVQRRGQLLLVDIMLIQAHADALRIDLHQLRKRVLQPPSDGHRPAHGHIQVGELGACQVGCGVHRRAGLADHHIGKLLALPCPGLRLDQLRNQPLGLPAGGAVADRDDGHAVELHQPREDLQRLRPLVLRRVRVDGGGVQQLAGRVHRGNLTARPEARVDAHDRRLPQRGLQEQAAQIGSKDLDGVVADVVVKLPADLALDGGP